MLSDTTVYDVGIAAVAAIPAIIAAIFAGIVALRTRTTNGRNIGRLAEDAANHAADTNARVTAMGDELEAQRTGG
jgi:type III secretory pathway component EscV